MAELLFVFTFLWERLHHTSQKQPFFSAFRMVVHLLHMSDPNKVAFPLILSFMLVNVPLNLPFRCSHEIEHLVRWIYMDLVIWSQMYQDLRLYNIAKKSVPFRVLCGKTTLAWKKWLQVSAVGAESPQWNINDSGSKGWMVLPCLENIWYRQIFF